MALKPWYKVVTPREDLRDGNLSRFSCQRTTTNDSRAGRSTCASSSRSSSWGVFDAPIAIVP